MATLAAETRRWTREEYERRIADGFFQPEERLELIDGLIFEMTPQNSWHAAAIQALQEALPPLFGKGYSLRIQLPLALGFDSEPEPDVAVVAGHWRNYRERHPATAVLVVEVAETTLLHDRERKASLYARAGIPDYWILNRAGACLEILRDPVDGAYRSKSVLRSGDEVSPLTRPGTSIAVADLLP